MPWQAPIIEKCPKCQKAVYANEALLAAGAKFHKMCFKCDMCNKLLESTNVAEHDGKLYCKNCHGKKFGPKGFGFGGGGSGLGTDSGERHGNTESAMSEKPTAAQIAGPKVEGGCPRCGKRVYEAEKKVGAGKDWHKTCFNCNNCHSSLDSSTLTEKDGEIYCKACYAKNFGPGGKI